MMNFSANRKRFLAVSAVFLFIALAAIALLGVRRDLPYQDGFVLTYTYQGELDSRPFQEAVETVVGRRVTVQAKTDWAAGLSSYEVSFPGDVALTTQEQMGLTATLASTFPENEIALDSALVLKAAVGWDFWLKCLLCMGVAAAVTVLFFSLRFPSIGGWQAGILTVAAFAHNLLLAAGGYALFRIPFGGQFFAVALVILFFTLYSAAGLFGHIRDNRRLLGKKVSPAELVNQSIVQYLPRLLTVLACAAMMLAALSVMALLGQADAILSFTFPLLVGILSCGYGAICLAGPLWAGWQGEKNSEKQG
ncbi:hypothetical protein [Merdimmobilis hominis]|uniref:hypothetical protein n=1 Tax=Merdimmobilis hominis TaxID=2897707 RepID=UPI0008F8A8DC|nr:hypothetical protein [Merdimmobilis hominis]PWL57994.1 MAG: hypothetical protein DBY34_07960 [Oscillospiraceae bacterium]